MILVDIYVPSVNRTYDFQLNENAQIATVIEEISEMVGQKERVQMAGDAGGLFLCDRQLQTVLPKEKTLRECGVITGKSLILV